MRHVQTMSQACPRLLFLAGKNSMSYMNTAVRAAESTSDQLISHKARSGLVHDRSVIAAI